MSLRKEARHKETLLDNLTNRDRAFGAHKDAVRANKVCRLDGISWYESYVVRYHCVGGWDGI